MVEHWFDIARYVYNQTVEYLRQPGTKANWKAIKGEILHSLPDFCADVPYQIKSIAIKDACTAVREAKKKYGKTQKINKVGFRSRKNPMQSCYIPKSAVKERGIYRTILGELGQVNILSAHKHGEPGKIAAPTTVKYRIPHNLRVMRRCQDTGQTQNACL